MTGYILTLGIFSGFYVIVLLLIFMGLGRLRVSTSDVEPFVSVVVAARNEEENIQALLAALTRQNYPSHLYEIIIIDDQSTDRTATIVSSFDSHKVRLYRTTNRDQVISPKKKAIHLGIQKAKGEIILLTDADCVPPECWIKGIVRLFTNDVGMVIGFSPCELPRLSFPVGDLLAIESLSLAAVAAGTSGLGYPATCNGRNLAYRKKVYEQVGGFDKIQNFVSGDDDLLLKLVQASSWKIQYAYDRRLVVPTKAVKNLRQFGNQRLRHASKGFHYHTGKVIGLILVYLYNVMIFFAVPLALFQNLSAWVPIFFIGLKAASEFILLCRFAAAMDRLHYMPIFPIAELLHVPYVVIIGALGPLKKFKWKEKGN